MHPARIIMAHMIQWATEISILVCIREKVLLTLSFTEVAVDIPAFINFFPKPFQRICRNRRFRHSRKSRKKTFFAQNSCFKFFPGCSQVGETRDYVGSAFLDLEALGFRVNVAAHPNRCVILEGQRGKSILNIQNIWKVESWYIPLQKWYIPPWLCTMVYTMV